MAAATLPLFPTIDHHPKPILKQKLQSFSLFTTHKLITHSNLPPCFSSSNNSSIFNETPTKFTSFLTNQELKNLKFLQNYTYSHKLPSGYLTIRVINDFEVDMIVELLAESFSESMLLPNNNMYLKLLGFLVKQYLIERRNLIPHCVSLIGYFKESENDVGMLSGTVEVSFDKKGANDSPPTPTPPKDSGYICNMTVKKEFRRRGIGWHLLKASEELISNMSSSRDVYLHCRLIDTAPFNMYQKAGYEVVKTDSFFILLTLQRRKHLMCKELPVVRKPIETVITEDEEEESSLVAEREFEPLLFDEVVQTFPDMDK